MYTLIIFWILGPTRVATYDLKPTVIQVEFSSMKSCQEAISLISKGTIPGERYYLCLKR